MEERESSINPRVLAGGQEFAKYSERFENIAPHYILDFSWPSVGLVDYYIQGLRGKANYTKVEEHVHLGASSYLAGLAFKCFSVIFPGALINVEYESKSISIEITGGSKLKDNQTVSIPVSDCIKKILSEPNNSLPFFAKTQIQTIPESNLVSLFSYGLLSGLTPYGKGPWNKLDMEAFPDEIEALNNLLSESASHYYRNNFPDESYGKNPALYSSGLIFPPAGYKESFLYFFAISGAVGHLLHLTAKRKEIHTLGINLAKNPDETISSVGYALAVASIEGDVSIQMEALADTFIERAPSLVPALILAKKALFEEEDWVVLLDSEEPETAIPQIELEKQLSLIPTLKLKTKRVSDPRFHPLLKLVRINDTQAGRAEVDRLIETGVATSDTILQGIAFDLYHNNLQRAQEELNSFPREYLEDDAELLSIYSELNATFHERIQEEEKAREILTNSLNRGISDKTILIKNLLFTSSYLIRENNWNELVKNSEAILKVSPGSISARINLYLALRMSGKEEDAMFLLEEIYKLSPMDRRVFGLVQSAFAS